MIRRLSLENILSFQSLRDLELKQLNVLVGPNMSGKSNLLRVINFLIRALSPPQMGVGVQQAILEYGGMRQLCWKGSQELSFRIEIEIECFWKDLGSRVYEYGLWVEESSSSVEVRKEYLYRLEEEKKEPIFEAERGKLQFLTPKMFLLGTTFPREKSFLEVFGINGFEGTIFRQHISQWRFYRLIPSVMRQSYVSASIPFLRENGQNFSSWLAFLMQKDSQFSTRFKQVVTDLFPHIKDINPVPTVYGPMLLLNEKYLKRDFIPNQFSDGELICLTFLALILAPNKFGAPLFCIEEPENFLHPYLIDNLVEIYLQRLREIEQNEQNAAQLLITTHSLHLIDKVNIENLLITSRKEGTTHISPPKHKAEVQEILSRKELGLGELFYSGTLEEED
jgi:predicted ATPase